ncbi:active regulator of SIRT1-like [Mytilus edulis]|uniref:active regulator of SIRT1-like n=1 Tax=Mytilus edulis TaxID=6550 RepID=UPI0039EFB8D9
MSSSILKRSLELFNEEDDVVRGDQKKKTKASSTGKLEKGRYKKKTNPRKKRHNKDVNRQTEDRTEKSIEFLQKLSKFNKTDSQTTKTILKYNKGRLSKNDEKMEPVDNSTVFSNTDFDKFEDEYDFFS